MKQFINMIKELSHKPLLRRKVFSSYLLKRWLLILAIITTMHCLYFWGAYQLKLDQITKQIEVYQRNTLHDTSVLFNDTFLSIERDTMYLKNSSHLQHLIAAHFQFAQMDQQNSNHLRPSPRLLLENFFINMMQSRVGMYSELRFIDHNGMEVVRIDNNNNKTIAAPTDELKNQIQRNYFQIAQKLTKDQIYISPLDLRMKDGQIEIPYNPILRVCIPAFNQSGQFMGIAVINVLANEVFDDLRKIAKWHDGDLWLVNQNGDWFLGPNSEFEWNFKFPGKNIPTLNILYPKLWARVHQQTNSYKPAHLTENGAIFSAVQFRPDIPDWVGKANIKADSHSRWYLIAVTTADKIQHIKGEIKNDLVVAFVILSFIFTIFSFLIALLSSHRKQAIDNYRLAKEEAEKASQAKSAFLSNMSHEIRTPLNAVLGLAYLLDRPSQPKDTQEIGHKILQAGQSLQSILNDILDFSKIEAGKLELTNEPFYMKETLGNVSTIMTSYAHNKSIELIISSDISPTLHLLGDKLRIEQVLINLVGNAIKFTSQGYVALKVQILEQDESTLNIHFSVEDTGIGMNQEAIGKIFNAFEQADSSTSKRFGGTGLGLSICTHLLALMGSNLHVNSEEGKGSIFSFQLILNKVKTNEQQISSLKQLNVLIADDHEIALDALNKTAKALNWQTTCVTDGEQAVKLATSDQNHFDIYLLDWKMPKLDGLSAAKKIKEHLGPDSNAVIVLVTSYSQQDLLHSPNAQYIDQVLEKPVTPSSLYDVALKILGNKKTDTGDVKSTDLTGVRLLVVDDNEYNRDIAERIFSLEGATVTAVDDGEKALEWLEEHSSNIDAVLMDIQMPIMDGYEATKHIRANEKLKDLVVIALTAGAFETQRKAALDAGMNNFIAKPFDVPKAVAIILESLGRDKTEIHTEQPDQKSSNADNHQSDKKEKLLNLEHTLSLWGDSKTVHRYLQKFLRDYGNISDVFEQLEHTDTAKLAHKLKGAAASLCLEQLTHKAGNVENVILTKGDVQTALTELKTCLQDTVTEIQKVLADIELPDSDSHATTTDISGQTQQLVIKLYKALDSDDPNTIRPLINQLSNKIDNELLTPVIHAVDDYDFEQAMRQVEFLAKHFNINLEV